MIPFAQQLIAVIFSLVLVLVTVQLIRTHRLREEYALVWLAASLGIFLLSIFGGLVGRLAALFSVTYSPTLVLVAGLLFALVVLLSQSVVISSQANQMRDLAQSVALLEWRLRQVETDGGRQPADGGKRTGDRRPETGDGLTLSNGGQQTADGKPQTADRGPEMANGNGQGENAEKQFSFIEPAQVSSNIEVVAEHE